jgi:hypothetical protein
MTPTDEKSRFSLWTVWAAVEEAKRRIQEEELT